MYIENEMGGATNLRAIINLFFKTRVPAGIDRIREQVGYDENTLPYPKRYDSVEPYKSKEWPFFGSYVNGTDNWVQVDTLESGSLVFEADYDVSIFVGAATAVLGSQDGMPLHEEKTYESAIRIRDDLLAITRALMLNYPSLGTAGEEFRAVVDISTIRETYPEATRIDKTNRYLAAGVINATIKYREPTTVPIYGPMNNFELLAQKIDDTP